MKILKTFDGSPTAEMDASGLFASATWERLKPLLEQLFRIQPQEQIQGIMADEIGIRVKIESRK